MTPHEITQAMRNRTPFVWRGETWVVIAAQHQIRQRLGWRLSRVTIHCPARRRTREENPEALADAKALPAPDTRSEWRVNILAVDQGRWVPQAPSTSKAAALDTAKQCGQLGLIARVECWECTMVHVLEGQPCDL